MLTEPLLQQLRMLVFENLGTDGSVATLAVLVGNQHVVAAPRVSRPFEMAVWVVELALRQPTPQLLAHIVQNVDLAETAPQLHDAVAFLQQHPNAWVAPRHDPLVVANGSPFVDRQAFRAHLDEIQAGKGPDVLVVSGEPGHGKSYLHEYCQKLDGWRLGIYEIRPSTAKEINAEDVATRIARGLKVTSPRPRRHEDSNRWATNLAAWIASDAPILECPGLVVLDGFEDPNVSPALHTLVLQLAQQIHQDPEVKKRFRLLLLGYDGSGRLSPQQLGFQTYALEFVTATMLEEWFRKRFPGKQAFQYEDAAALVLEDLPVSGVGRMERLCTMVIEAMGSFT